MAKGITDDRYRQLLVILIEARKGVGLSQADVATKLNKPQQFVSRYELGERRLDVIEYLDIAAALGLDALTTLLGLAESHPEDGGDSQTKNRR
ncbi:helix-turn-helix domain-containing protein [Sphingomonas flavalba]|uniref:helix-turn-helix domain-containing protein n=1 Tax=Sphingomonas flavalba TaxID=2559804 RepID=UPI0039E1B949